MSSKSRSSAIEKGLVVLEALADQPQAVGLPDLAARLGIARQTVHRVLCQLMRAGLVVRDHRRERYCIGPRQTRLALATLCSKNRGTRVRLLLREFVDALGETCNIGVLDDLDFVYVERIECKWPLRMVLDSGSRIGAHACSGGKILLAQLDPTERRGLLRRWKPQAYTAKTLTRPAELDAELEKARAKGFALNNQEFMKGIVGVAVPIEDATGRVVAALAMHGPLPRLSIKACQGHVPRLKRAAERIGKAWHAD